MTPSNGIPNVTATMVNIAAQKAAVEAQYKALIAGITSELASESQFVINGAIFSKSELLARFQARLEAAEKTKADRTTLTTTVAAERQWQHDVAPLRMAFKQFLQSRYGKSSPVLQKFGFTPVKKAQRPVVNKAAGIAKNVATRTARGTVGKKAKLKITGTPAPAPMAGAPSTHPSPGAVPSTPSKATSNPTPGNT